MLEYYPYLVEASMRFKVHSKKLLLENAKKQNEKRKKKKKIDVSLFVYDYWRDCLPVAAGYSLM